MDDSQRDRVAEVWGETARSRQDDPRRGWLDSNIVMWDYVQPLVSGERRRGWPMHAAAVLGIDSASRWVSLGCGAGGTEIWCAGRGLFAHLDGFDISPGAIAVARQAAVAAGVAERLDFGVIDVENPALPTARYDVALFAMALHHVTDLEGCLAAVERSLRPGGGLIVNEYIGPARQQFTDLQMEIARELLETLPPRLRLLRDGTLKQAISRRTAAEWIAADPSEAVRSPEIPAVIAERFEIVLRRDYGGTILSLLLEDIIHNFDSERADDVAFVKLLGAAEQRLIRQGVLSSDFTVIAARRR